MALVSHYGKDYPDKDVAKLGAAPVAVKEFPWFLSCDGIVCFLDTCTTCCTPGGYLSS